MNERLLDTDILSEILKGRNQQVGMRARAHVAAGGRITTSVVTILEVVRGLQKERRDAAIDKFLIYVSTVAVMPVGTDEAVLGGRIEGDLERTGQPIGPADALIAAVAIRCGAVLVTGNTRHYERIQKLGYPLELENWRVT